MSGQGAPQLTVDGTGMTVEIVASSWHTAVMDGLIAGASTAAQQAGADYRIRRVAGSLELVPVVEALARAGSSVIVALGVVIRGGTPHFEYVCDAVTRGLMDTSRTHQVAVGFGVLTCDDEVQALDRAGLASSREDAGGSAVIAALGTAAVLAQIGRV